MVQAYTITLYNKLIQLARWLMSIEYYRVGQIQILCLKRVFSMAKLPAEYEYDNGICL